MPSGYSKTPLHKKLVIKDGARLLLLIGSPPGWSIPEPSAGVRGHSETLATESIQAADVIIAFYRSSQELRGSIGKLAQRIFPDGAIWSAWPRRATGHDSDISERDIRALALGLGLVDVKVAALDEDWSGLRLVWRREHRHTLGAPRQ